MVDLQPAGSLDQFVKTVATYARKWQSTVDLRTESSWLPWFRGEESARLAHGPKAEALSDKAQTEGGAAAGTGPAA